MAAVTSLAFNVLIKEENGLWTAHCLELDIVAAGDTIEGVEKEIVDLIRAQFHYAIAHNNLAHLYHAAPPEVWQEFLSCKDRWERRHRFTRGARAKSDLAALPPFEIIANTCRSERICHA